MTDVREQMIHLNTLNPDFAIKSENSDLPSVFCILSSVIWKRTPETHIPNSRYENIGLSINNVGNERIQGDALPVQQ